MSTMNYPLFELMSREHGLALLETEMQEIRDVCLAIEAVHPTKPNEPSALTNELSAEEILATKLMVWSVLPLGAGTNQAEFHRVARESAERLRSLVAENAALRDALGAALQTAAIHGASTTELNHIHTLAANPARTP